SGSNGVRSCSVSDRVLQLIVVEDSSLREERGREPAEDPYTADGHARKQELRPEVERRRVLSSKQNVESSIRDPQFVGHPWREDPCVVCIKVLHAPGGIDSEALERRRELVGYNLVIEEITRREIVSLVRRPIDARKKIIGIDGRGRGRGQDR